VLAEDFHNGENSDHVNALIRENRRITVHELSGILNISDGSLKTLHTTPILESVHPMDPAFVDGQTQENMAASGAIVAVRAGRKLFLDSIVTADALLHSGERQRTRRRCITSRRRATTDKT